MIVPELEAKGLRVKITHYRVSEEHPSLPARPFSLKALGETIRPRGGLTAARIYPADEDKYGSIEVVGWSYCSDKDNYSKKIGRDIALGRAMKKLNGGLAASRSVSQVD